MAKASVNAQSTYWESGCGCNNDQIQMHLAAATGRQQDDGSMSCAVWTLKMRIHMFLAKGLTLLHRPKA